MLIFYQRFFRQETPWGRLGLFVPLSLDVIFADAGLHAAVTTHPEIPAGLCGDFVLCFVSYHYLVRSTWVGLWLNGKKMSRKISLPSLSAHERAALVPGSSERG